MKILMKQMTPTLAVLALSLSIVQVGNAASWVTNSPLITSRNGTSPNPLDLWTNRDSGTVTDLFGITYGAGIFVAVGHSGAILTSVDGATWTNQSAPSTNHLNDMIYANGTFIAVGIEEYPNFGAILTSTDGVGWTNRMSGTFGTTFKGITYGTGIYVAVGNGGIIATSPDGATWTGQDVVTNKGLNAVTFANGMFVAVGNGPDHSTLIWISTNGTTWRIISRLGQNLRGVTYGNGIFVAVGNDGTILNSSDGNDWTETVSGTGWSLRGVTYANGVFVAVGNSGVILSSPDGTNWTSRTSATGTEENLHNIAYANGTFVAVGNAGTIVQSASFAPAQLTVLRNRPNHEGIELAVTGEIGRSYRLQANDNLSTTNWIDLFSFNNTQGVTTLFLDSQAVNFAQRFYRVVSP
jgi:hypothetical protein